MAPDATSVGWPISTRSSMRAALTTLQELRSFQDWYRVIGCRDFEGRRGGERRRVRRRSIRSRSIPSKMKARNVSVGEVAAAVRGANDEVGGRVIEMAQHE